jgi:hypothetical protein
MQLSFDVKADGTVISQKSPVAIATGYDIENESSIFGEGRNFFPDQFWSSPGLLVNEYLEQFSRDIAAAANRRSLIFL